MYLLKFQVSCQLYANAHALLEQEDESLYVKVDAEINLPILGRLNPYGNTSKIDGNEKIMKIPRS